MSTDLRTQLEAYYTSMLEEQPPIESFEVARRMDAVRPIPNPTRGGPLRPILVIAATVIVAVAIIGIPLFLTRSGETTPPATEDSVTTTAPSTETTQPADPTTTVPDTSDVESYGTGPYEDWTWVEKDIPGAGQIASIDGLLIRFDSSGYHSVVAEQEGADSYDETSYYWWSTDAENWTRVPLPDVVGPPTSWYYATSTGTAWASDFDGNARSFTVERGPDGLVLADTSSEEPPSDAGFNVPQMQANGLIPKAWVPIGGLRGTMPAVSSVDQIQLAEGSIWFDFPEDVRSQLPPSNGGEGGGSSETARTGHTFRAFDDSGIVWEEVWTVDGQRISVELILFDDAGPRTIHTGWVDLPDDFVPIMTPEASSFPRGYAVDVVWRSTDGGSTFAPAQPNLVKEYDPFEPGRFLIAFDDQFLWYFEHADGSADVWSSPDGTTWTLETLRATSLETYNMMEVGDRLMAPSNRGIAVSEDGIIWSYSDAPGRGWGNPEVSAVGVTFFSNASILISRDGVEWYEIAVPGEVISADGGWYREHAGDWIVLYTDGDESEPLRLGRLP